MLTGQTDVGIVDSGTLRMQRVGRSNLLAGDHGWLKIARGPRYLLRTPHRPAAAPDGQSPSMPP